MELFEHNGIMILIKIKETLENTYTNTLTWNWILIKRNYAKNCDLVERTRIFILQLSERKVRERVNKQATKNHCYWFFKRTYFIKQQQI